MSLALCNPTNSGSASINIRNNSQEELIIENLPLVKFLAQRLQTRLPASIEVDDLISAGGANGFAPAPTIRSDQVFVRGVRLPFLKFPRSPNL